MWEDVRESSDTVSWLNDKIWKSHRGRSLETRKFTTGGGLNSSHEDRFVKHGYFDNCNELVERMRLLVSEKRVQNNSYDSEISSIIEELRESGIVINTPARFQPNF